MMKHLQLCVTFGAIQTQLPFYSIRELIFILVTSFDVCFDSDALAPYQRVRATCVPPWTKRRRQQTCACHGYFRWVRATHTYRRHAHVCERDKELPRRVNTFPCTKPLWSLLPPSLNAPRGPFCRCETSHMIAIKWKKKIHNGLAVGFLMRGKVI